MSNYNTIFNEQVGKELEGAIFDSIRTASVLFNKVDYSKTEKQYGYCKPSTKEQDLYEGTDMFWSGIRIDATFNVEHKKLHHEYDTVVGDWLVSIKTHNGRCPIDPVIVLALKDDYEPYYVRNYVIPNMDSMIRNNYILLLETVENIMYAYEDSLEE